MQALDEALEAEQPGLSRKVLVKKNIDEPSLKIELKVSSTKDLVPIAKLLYEKRKSLFDPLLRL